MTDDPSRAKVTPSPDLRDCIQCLRSTLRQHVGIINQLIGVLSKHPSATHLAEKRVPDEVCFALKLMLQALGSSCNTLVALSDAPGLQTRDCYGIGRSIVEMSINVCYIIAEGRDAAERAIRHARQKSHQDLQRESQVAQSIIRAEASCVPDPASVDGLEEDLREFTSSAGREKGWTDLSVDKRIAAVGEQLGHSVLTSLHLSRFVVYRHSSEILHGTLFGASYFLGVSQSPRPASNVAFAEHVGGQHMMILFSAIGAASAVAEAFHCRYECPSLHEQSTNLFRQIGSLPYFRTPSEPSESAWNVTVTPGAPPAPGP